MNFLKLISGHLLNYGDQVIKSVKVFKLFFICTNYYKQVLYNTIRGFLPRPLFFFLKDQAKLFGLNLKAVKVGNFITVKVGICTLD